MTQDHPPEESGPDPALPPARVESAPSPAAPPTPVRSSLAAAPPAADEEPAPAEVVLELSGRRWIVRERGRSQGGPTSAPVHLLLLGFFADPGDAQPGLEALVAARGLDEMTPARLESALREATAPPAAWERKPLFPEINTKGKRDG